MSETTTQETTDDAELHDSDTGTTGPVSDNGPAGAETPRDEPKGNREARYRVERNEARTALSEAQSHITALQTREVERLAGEHLAQPADLLSLGDLGLADFLTPEGWVDHDAVAEAAAELVESRPGLARNPKVRAVDLTQGSGGSIKSAPTWSDLFK